MDLDNIKKVWKEQKNASFSREEILAMLQKKSSSVAKWIFYISLAEFAFWIILSLVVPERDVKIDRTTNSFMNFIAYTNHIIIIIFIIIFFRNYLKVKANQSINKLLKNIFNVRKTVQYYIIYNIAMFVISTIIGAVLILSSDESSIRIPEHVKDSNAYWAGVIVGITFFSSILLTALYFFYKLLYGFLLRRLQKNYDEIKDLQ